MAKLTKEKEKLNMEKEKLKNARPANSKTTSFISQMKTTYEPSKIERERPNIVETNKENTSFQ